MKIDLTQIADERLFMNSRNIAGALSALVLAGFFVARSYVTFPIPSWMFDLTATVFVVFIVLVISQVVLRFNQLAFLYSDKREKIDERPRYTLIRHEIKRPRVITNFYFGLLVLLLYMANMWFFGGPLLIAVVVNELVTDLCRNRMDSLVYDKLQADDEGTGFGRRAR